MTPADRPAFTQLLTDVLAFYGQTTSPFALSVWWEASKGIDLSVIRGAFTAYAMDPARGHFAPKPADLIRAVRGTSDERAMAAWLDLLGQVRGVGSYGAPQLSDAARAGLDAIGGWLALCQSGESSLTFLQRQFSEGYAHAEAAQERAKLGNASSPLKLA